MISKMLLNHKLTYERPRQEPALWLRFTFHISKYKEGLLLSFCVAVKTFVYFWVLLGVFEGLTNA